MHSPLELEFVVHYREMDMKSGKWTGMRIRRLCNLMKLTKPEFARLIRLMPHQLDGYVEDGKFPGCVKLVLELIERAAHRTYLGKAFDNSLFPTGTL